MKRAFITGVTGQDGSYLVELLLKKGYKVWGFVRRSSTLTRERIDHIEDPNFDLIYGDMTDAVSIMNALKICKPDEIYNLAAQSHVKISYEIPAYTAMTVGVGVLNLLEGVRILGLKSKIYQASTSELYSGKYYPQNENTPFEPQSPYAAAKLYAHNICKQYREAYGMFISCGILFNHESPRRGENFITRKVTIAVNRIKAGLQDKLEVGNTSAKRDWGDSREYVYGMWLMLQQDKPDDFVLATGETHTVQELIELAFNEVGLNWEKYVVVNPKFYRPNEVNVLQGDPSKAKRVLGWEAKTKFKDLIKLMVKTDELKKE